MPDWNPHSPDVIGLEYAPNVVGQSLVGRTPAATSVLTASLDEAISSAVPYLGVVVPGSGAFLPVVVDIYDATDPANPPWDVLPAGGGTVLPIATSDPTADTVTSPSLAWVGENGATTNLYTHLDENELTLNTADYVDYWFPGVASAYLRFKASTQYKDASNGTTLVDFSARRIAQVNIRAWVANLGTKTMAVVGVLTMVSGTPAHFWRPQAIIHARSGLQRAAWGWTTNPVTGLPWTHADVATFSPGGVNDFGLWLIGSLSSGDTFRVYAVQFEVIWANETRVATGKLQLSPHAGYAWTPVVLRDPISDGVAAWQKKAGHTYWITVSQPQTTTGTVVWQFVDGDTLGGVEAQATPLNASGQGVPDPGATWPPPVDTRAHALLLSNDAAGASYSPDSQPYASAAGVNVSVSSTVVQSLTAPPSVPFGLAFVWARSPSGAVPTAPLSVDIVDVSSGNPVAGPTTIDPFAVDDTGTFQRYLVTFDTVFTPVVGHTYAVRLQSATPSSLPWHVLYLDALNPVLPGNASAADTGYGGQSACLTVAGVVNGQQDAPVVLGQMPPVIAGVAAVAYGQRLSSSTSPCAVTMTGAVELSWSPSTLDPGVFAYIEIQRSDGPEGYATIARLVDSAAVVFYDFEVRRNVTASYRIRQVRTDGGAADWSSVVAMTIAATSTDFLLVSNLRPDLNVGYIFEPDQEYDFLDNDKVVLRQLFGRDYQVAYRPIETRGDHFVRTCTLAFNDSGAPVGRAAFEAVRAITRAQIPYVCVLDGDGNRWYGSVKVEKATRSEPGGRYHADVDVTQVVGVAAAVRVAWQPSPDSSTMTIYGDPSGTYGDSGTETYGG